MIHPEWALKHKIKGTELRLIKGKYYLYQVSSVWDKTKKRAQKITNKYLGTITESGLVEPKCKRDALDIKDSVAVKEHGACSFMLNTAEEIKQRLSEIFPEDADKLITLAILRAIHQSPFKRIEHLYDHSYLSEMMPRLNLSGKDISLFLRDVGKKRDKIVQFMKCFVEGSKHIIFDATNIISQSKKMTINRPGYNSHMNFDPQVNLLYAFAYDCDAPVYYRILPGNIRDVSAFKISVAEAGLENSVVVADKGFGSKANINMLDDQKLQYVIPLRRNNSLFDDIPIRSGNKGDFDDYFIFNKRPIWHYSKAVEGNKKVIVFIDAELKSEEEKDYLIRIENQLEGYTKEGFIEKQYRFGSIIIITNIDKSAKDIFEILKSRGQVEQVFDTLKNLLESDASYMQNEQALEAWAFINHISMMLLYKIYALLKKHKLLAKFSALDVIEHFKYIFKLRINNQWVTSEISSKTTKLLTSMECRIT